MNANFLLKLYDWQIKAENLAALYKPAKQPLIEKTENRAKLTLGHPIRALKSEKTDVKNKFRQNKYLI